ncbi:MAG: hypothetical protein ACPGU7_01055 [Gammaproteobacteria bacterium]
METDQALSAMEQIAEKEHQMMAAEIRYRLLASTWLLAFFAGFGFLVSLDSEPVRLFGVLMLSVMASIGITMLRGMDHVYHKLLDAAFHSGLILESDHPELPQIRHEALVMFRPGEMLRFAGIFYGTCATVPLTVAIANALFLQAASPALAAVAVFISVVCEAGVIAVCLHHHRDGVKGVQRMREGH